MLADELSQRNSVVGNIRFIFGSYKYYFHKLKELSGAGQDIPACDPAVWQALEKVFHTDMSSLLCEPFQNVQLYSLLSSFTLVVYLVIVDVTGRAVADEVEAHARVAEERHDLARDAQGAAHDDGALLPRVP